jgi:hypothetical protein
MFMKNSREVRGENAESYVAVIASAAKQSMRQQEGKSGLFFVVLRAPLSNRGHR